MFVAVFDFISPFYKMYRATDIRAVKVLMQNYVFPLKVYKKLISLPWYLKVLSVDRI